MSQCVKISEKPSGNAFGILDGACARVFCAYLQIVGFVTWLIVVWTVCMASFMVSFRQKLNRDFYTKTLLLRYCVKNTLKTLASLMAQTPLYQSIHNLQIKTVNPFGNCTCIAFPPASMQLFMRAFLPRLKYLFLVPDNKIIFREKALILYFFAGNSFVF